MFFKKKENKLEDNYLTKIASLLIHAAKIDEHYTKEEEEIIKDTLIQLGSNTDSINHLIEKAKSMEENSNQILDFTREVKNLKESEKIKIVEALWRIIYSNKDADMYETNLMRRLAGLLYIDNQVMGDIKEKIKKEKSS
ncbi:MAG: TerB family tellurite resistance protein [Candidatus Pelagibacter sp.]